MGGKEADHGQVHHPAMLWAIPTLLIVTFLVYVALRIGTNPLESYKRINQRASEQEDPGVHRHQRAVRRSGGYVRGYFQWLGQFVTGDWPRTIKGSREVWPQPAGRDGQLAAASAAWPSIVGITIGLSIGVFAALRPGGLRDTIVNTAAFFGLSIPPYVSAVLLPADLRRLLGPLVRPAPCSPRRVCTRPATAGSTCG